MDFETDILPFLRAYLADLPEVVKSWMVERRVITVAQDIADLYWLAEQDTADRPYLIDLPAFGQVFAAQRFEKRAFQYPFIDVMAKTFVLQSVEQLHRLAGALAPHFHTHWIHIPVWGDPLPVSDNLLPHFRLLVAPLGELRRRPKPVHYDEITLKRARDLSYYSHYAAAYDAFHAEAPHLKTPVPKDSRSLQMTFIRHGLVYNAFIGETWVGLISAIETEEMGLRGLEIADVIIAKAFRGKGYAAAIQYHLLEQMTAPDDTLIMGTINWRNQPSLKTALRIGRLDIGGGYFVKSL